MIGKVVMITGGGAGIGRAFAHRFAAEGADVVIGDIDPAAADKVVSELRGDGHRAVSHVMDVTDAEQVTATVAHAESELGGIDILVNNAGVHLDHAQLPFTVDAVARWRRVLDVNVLGVLLCSAACRSSMSSRGGGAIVNMSSMAAYGAGGAYAVSKLAVNSLTVSLANDLAVDSIRVNGIAPGLVDSEAAVAWWSDPSRAGRAGIDQMIIEGQMLKRQGRMDDIANMCLFLCSDDASFVTGQTILVDGGHTKKPF
jgi:NAD(P)-dependent dehydrogenase (short-subunit alcohol dehydrogenase family)